MLILWEKRFLEIILTKPCLFCSWEICQCRLCHYFVTNKYHFIKHFLTKHSLDWFKCKQSIWIWLKFILQVLLKTFHRPPWTSIVWHFKYFLKVKFFSQDSNCHSCAFKFKIKSDFKVHVKTKHVQLFFMLCFMWTLKSDLVLNLETHNSAILRKLKVSLAMSLSF